MIFKFRMVNFTSDVWADNFFRFVLKQNSSKYLELCQLKLFNISAKFGNIRDQLKVTSTTATIKL